METQVQLFKNAKSFGLPIDGLLDRNAKDVWRRWIPDRWHSYRFWDWCRCRIRRDTGNRWSTGSGRTTVAIRRPATAASSAASRPVSAGANCCSRARDRRCPDSYKAFFTRTPIPIQFNSIIVQFHLNSTRLRWNCYFISLKLL